MKKLKLSKIHMLFLFLLMSGSFMAQNLGNLTNEWELIEETNGVQFFARVEGCILSEQSPKPFDIAFLKIVNNNSTDVQVAYNFLVQYTEGCFGCAGEDESYFTQKISATSTLEENCGFKQQGMAHTVRNQNFKGGWNFEKVALANVKID